MGLLLFLFITMNNLGKMTVETLFTMNSPFCWNPVEIGIFSGLRILVQNLSGVLIIKVGKGTGWSIFWSILAMCWMDQYLDVHGRFVVVSCVCVRACVRAGGRAGVRAGGRVCVRACVRACARVSCFFSLKVGLGEYQRKILFDTWTC